jgi:hypothetical protein
MLCHFHGVEERFHLERTISLPLDLTDHAKKYPEKSQISSTGSMFYIDGQLDEESWQVAPTIARLIPRQADGYAPFNTEAWVTFDDSFLYVAVRCHEPVLGDILSEVTTRDGNVRNDDSIELLLDVNNDKKTFHHFAVNPGGVLYDARRDDQKWDSTAIIASAKEEGAWTMEIAIPLKEINANPAAQGVWGFQMVRNRPRFEEKKSYQWSPTFWYGNYMPKFFGILELR